VLGQIQLLYGIEAELREARAGLRNDALRARPRAVPSSRRSITISATCRPGGCICPRA
jgi:hypothetical protein